MSFTSEDLARVCFEERRQEEQDVLVSRRWINEDRIIFDYRDHRLPCLCTRESCPEDHDMSFGRILFNRTFEGPEWLMIKPRSDTDEVKEMYPILWSGVYSTMENILNSDRFVNNAPRAGHQGFALMLKEMLWDSHKAYATQELASGLWRLCSDEYRRRVCCVTRGKFHFEVERKVLRELEANQSLYLCEIGYEPIRDVFRDNFVCKIDEQNFLFEDEDKVEGIAYWQ